MVIVRGVSAIDVGNASAECLHSPACTSSVRIGIGQAACAWVSAACKECGLVIALVPEAFGRCVYVPCLRTADERMIIGRREPFPRAAFVMSRDRERRSGAEGGPGSKSTSEFNKHGLRFVQLESLLPRINRPCAAVSRGCFVKCPRGPCISPRCSASGAVREFQPDPRPCLLCVSPSVSGG